MAEHFARVALAGRHADALLALEALQEADPVWRVWRSGRGVYALEEPWLAELMHRDGLLPSD